jgi:hypothetical protein
LGILENPGLCTFPKTEHKCSIFWEHFPKSRTKMSYFGEKFSKQNKIVLFLAKFSEQNKIVLFWEEILRNLRHFRESQGILGCRESYRIP